MPGPADHADCEGSEAMLLLRLVRRMRQAPGLPRFMRNQIARRGRRVHEDGSAGDPVRVAMRLATASVSCSMGASTV